MSDILEKLYKVDENIIQIESILMNLKGLSKNEILEEKVEYFESMLSKLNLLKDSYLQLFQFESPGRFSRHILNNYSELLNFHVNNTISSKSQNISDISTENELEILSEENILKKLDDELSNEQYLISNIESIKYLMNCNNDLKNTNNHSFSETFYNNFVNKSELSFYLSILNQYIEFGSKVMELAETMTIKSVWQSSNNLRDVIQNLIELHKLFQCFENSSRKMDTIVPEELKINFATCIKYFESVINIIQIHLKSNQAQIEIDCCETDLRQDSINDAGVNIRPSVLGNRAERLETKCLPQELCCHQISKHSIISSSIGKFNNHNNNSVDYYEFDNNNPNNDEYTENSNDSCHGKDRDGSMEIGGLTTIKDSINNKFYRYSWKPLRYQVQRSQNNGKPNYEKQNLNFESADFTPQKKSFNDKMTDILQDYSQNCNYLKDFSVNSKIYPSEISYSEKNIPLFQNKTNRPSSLSLRYNMSNNDKNINYDNPYQNPLTKRFENFDISPPPPQEFQVNTKSYIYSLLPKIFPECGNNDIKYPIGLLEQSKCRINQIHNIMNRNNDSFNPEDSCSQELYHNYYDCKNGSELSNDQDQYKSKESLDKLLNLTSHTKCHLGMFLNQFSDLNSTSNSYPSVDKIDENIVHSNSYLYQGLPRIRTASGFDSQNHIKYWKENSVSDEIFLRYPHQNNIPILSRALISNDIDEISRVAPIGQSSIFSNSSQSDLTWKKNVSWIDFTDIKNEVENIAVMCRKMSVEQNRMARDLSDLKRGLPQNINNNYSNNSSDVAHHILTPPINTDNYMQKMMIINNDNQFQMANQIINNNNDMQSVNMTNTNLSNDETYSAKPVLQKDPIYGDSLLKHFPSNEFTMNHHQSPFYWSQMELSQNMMKQHNMILQTHSTFLNLQMSLIASNFEFQYQQMMFMRGSHNHFPPRDQCQVLPIRNNIVPLQSFHDPPGSLSPTCWNMISNSDSDMLSAFHDNNLQSFSKTLTKLNENKASHFDVDSWNQFSAIDCDIPTS